MPPRVFISYSHDAVVHQKRVLSLADRLRVDGIDVEIDQYHGSPAEGWPHWCEQQIEDADFVLMVCTESYYHNVKGERKPQTGRGVVWEAAIIRQLLYDAGMVSEKFVPVLFSEDQAEHIPTMIRGRTHYIADTDDGYHRLLRHLTGQPRSIRSFSGHKPKRQWSPSEECLPPVPERTVISSGAGSVSVGGDANGAIIKTSTHTVAEKNEPQKR